MPIQLCLLTVKIRTPLPNRSPAIRRNLKPVAAQRAGVGNNGKNAPVPLSAMTPKLQPLQPKLDSGTASQAKPPASTNPPALPAEENYPVIATLETAVFGTPNPGAKIEDRLSKLENAVFRKDFPEQSLFDRTERLKTTLLGVQQPTFDLDPGSALNRSRFVEPGGQEMQSYYDDIAARPENQVEVSDQELMRFFVELVNGERNKFGFFLVVPEELAGKIAQTHVDDLCRRGVVSHQDQNGNNPDRRYTLAGGTDLLFESVVAVKVDDASSCKRNRATVARIFKTILRRQDERDALLATDATAVGFALNFTPAKDRVIACSDVITHHGVMQPIATDWRVGDKVDVKGVIAEPYKFDRVTVAWEAANNKLTSVADESDEALPYFAPLDYAAFAKSSDHDYSTALTLLRTAGVVAAIAGGVFMPPVALAAPMIAMSGGIGPSEPKPVSDIPIKGGVHCDGNAFSAKVPLNHEGKEGLYYITVWASITKNGKPIPISRRAILASSVQEATTESVSAQEVNNDNQKVKKHKHNKNSNNYNNTTTSNNSN